MSYAVLNTPPRRNGAAHWADCMRYSEMLGGGAAAMLRETLVMLLAAFRSSVGIMAVTYDCRVGTSICDKVCLSSRKATDVSNVGARPTAISNMFDGMCVKTMVFSRPILLARGPAKRKEAAVTIWVTKTMA